MPPEALANSSPIRWLPNPMPCYTPAMPPVRENCAGAWRRFLDLSFR